MQTCEFVFVGGIILFVGRERELERLNQMYASGRFEFAVIYGRRRVGKTTLIKEFCRDKPAIYFVAREANGEINLENFSKDVYAVRERFLSGNSRFYDWESAFAYVGQLAQTERLILVIDEYPYLAEGFPPVSSMIQAHIDGVWKSGQLFLILCGSSMSFMENQVLGYQSPLYGRRTAQFKILPFDFFESQPFLAAFAPEDKAVLYGITGGIPEYLSKVQPRQSVRENIVGLYLSPDGVFFEEPGNLLKQELREPATYNGIIEAIARGASRLSDIAAKNHMESNKCAKYLASLISLGLVKKEIPVTETVSKKSIYLLDDQMFRFWYRFVFPNLSNIVSGLGKQVYDYEVEPQLSAYMGLVFEQICMQYMVELMRRNALPFFIGKLGRWWGNNPHLKRQEEIDIMTYREGKALFGECKWTNSLVDSDVLHDLMEQSRLFHFEENYFYLFAKRGFTAQCQQQAAGRDNVRLITFAEMMG